MQTRSAALLALALLFSTARAAGEERLRVRATLAELPRAPACSGRTYRVLTRYRVERLLAGGPLRAESIAVMHRCPEFARGLTRYGRGSAPPLRPGHVHLLDLQPYQGQVDAAPENPPASQFEALRTDLAPPPPRVAVVVTGPAGAKLRLDFDAEAVTVGRAADSDVLLNHRQVALRQLLLEVRGEQVVVSDLQPGRVRLKGAPLRGQPAITHKDELRIGPYAINVSLFLPAELGPTE